jgi:hypothetical protein
MCKMLVRYTYTEKGIISYQPDMLNERNITFVCDIIYVYTHLHICIHEYVCACAYIHILHVSSSCEHVL